MCTGRPNLPEWGLQTCRVDRIQHVRDGVVNFNVWDAMSAWTLDDDALSVSPRALLSIRARGFWTF